MILQLTINGQKVATEFNSLQAIYNWLDFNGIQIQWKENQSIGYKLSTNKYLHISIFDAPIIHTEEIEKMLRNL